MEGIIALTPSQSQEYRAMQQEPPLSLPIDEKGNCGLFHPYKLLSVYESYQSHQLYHVHPELVHYCPTQQFPGTPPVEKTLLCPQCAKDIMAKKKPALALASGVDFGVYTRLPLDPLSLLEVYAIAKLRRYHSILQVESNGSTSGCTNFTQQK